MDAASPRARMEKPPRVERHHIIGAESPRAHGETRSRRANPPLVRRVPARAWRNRIARLPIRARPPSPRARMEKPCSFLLLPSSCCESPRAHGETAARALLGGIARRVPARAWRNRHRGCSLDDVGTSPRARMEKPQRHHRHSFMGGESPRAHGETGSPAHAGIDPQRVPARAWRNPSLVGRGTTPRTSPRARMEKPPSRYWTP